MSTKTKQNSPRVERYIDRIIRYRWSVLAASILLAIGIGSGARHLGLSSDYRVFFGAERAMSTCCPRSPRFRTR